MNEVAEAWRDLEARLEALADAGFHIPFWWRDDDAVAATPALQRLLDLSERTGVPVTLACIPMKVELSLVDLLKTAPLATPAVHGFRHSNHAPPNEKKAEFGAHRPVDAMTAEAQRGLDTMRSLFGEALLPLFVPPWNRMAPQLKPILPELGYQALSTYSGASGASSHGLRVIDTHIDPIDWRKGGAPVDPASLIRSFAIAVQKRLDAALTDPDQSVEPLGLLTHHLVHEEEIWSIINQLLRITGKKPAIRPYSARDLVGSPYIPTD